MKSESVRRKHLPKLLIGHNAEFVKCIFQSVGQN